MIVRIADFAIEEKGLDVPVKWDETLEDLSWENLKIIQKKKGYRYSMDSILLAHFCQLKNGNGVIDLGTGNAIIPLILARRNLTIQIVGVEIQVELIDMAHRNILINEMENRISLFHRDVRELTGHFEKATFDVAITNPPYRSIPSGRLNRRSQKALARHEILGSLTHMAQVASHLLRPTGRFYAVYPASRIVDLFNSLMGSDLEPKRVRMVHSNSREEAKLVMIEATKGGKRELRVMPPLFVYDLDGRYTADMEGISVADTDPNTQGAGEKD